MHLTTNAVRRPESTTTQIEKETVALHPFPPFIHSHPSSIPTLHPFPPFIHSHPLSIPTLYPFPPFIHSHPLSIPTLYPFPPFIHSHPLNKVRGQAQRFEPSLPDLKSKQLVLPDLPSANSMSVTRRACFTPASSHQHLVSIYNLPRLR
jgi:hypothetical protein